MATESAKMAAAPALLQARGLCKQFVQRRLFSRKGIVIHALNGVDFDVAPHCLTALVGESGSGKSTLASCLAMLERPEQGEIWFEGEEIACWDDQQLRALRPKIQVVFQDSAGALNPRFAVAQIIAEPLEIQGREHGARLRSRACELMEEVGLLPELADRTPLQLSGGQRQRLAIARAIALRPELLILDESLSGLDLSTQAQIVNLLLDLRSVHGLTYLLISHDLSLVAQVADFVAVMHKGQIVECGTRAQVLGAPRHDHTRSLLASIHNLETEFHAASAGGWL